MKQDGGPAGNRRAFFSATARTLAAWGLAAFAIRENRKRRRLSENPDCLRLVRCSECVIAAACPVRGRDGVPAPAIRPVSVSGVASGPG